MRDRLKRAAVVHKCPREKTYVGERGKSPRKVLLSSCPRRPPAALLHIEARRIARALGLPMHSMPSELLGSLAEYGLSCVASQLSSFSLVAWLNLVRHVRYFGRVLQLVDDHIDDDDDTALLGRDVWAGWRARSLAVQLAKLWRDADSVGLWGQIHPYHSACLARYLLPSLW